MRQIYARLSSTRANMITSLWICASTVRSKKVYQRLSDQDSSLRRGRTTTRHVIGSNQSIRLGASSVLGSRSPISVRSCDDALWSVTVRLSVDDTLVTQDRSSLSFCHRCLISMCWYGHCSLIKARHDIPRRSFSFIIPDKSKTGVR